MHSLYFLVIDNDLPILCSQTGLTSQTHIKVSSRDVFLNNVSISLKVFSKNYRRTSKNLARLRTAKTQRKEREEKKRKKGKESRERYVRNSDCYFWET